MSANDDASTSTPGTFPRSPAYFPHRTDFRCMFIATSLPITVPCTTVPFFNSTLKVSPDSFIMKPVSFMVLPFQSERATLERHVFAAGAGGYTLRSFKG